MYLKFLSGMVLLCSLSVFSAQVNTKKIISYSDRTRGAIPEGLEWTVKLASVEEGDSTEREFFIKYKSNDSYVENISPPKYKGEVFLFKGRSLWYFKPGLRAPVSVSARQKLTGAASNGDIASTNYSQDYTATFVKMDKIEKEDCYLFHLKSNADDTTYDQIDYWISKKTGLALKANFLSLEGKPLKTATFGYKNQISYKGKKYPFINEMTIVDANNPNNQSTLTYSNPKVRKLSKTIFNVNNLKR